MFAPGNNYILGNSRVLQMEVDFPSWKNSRCVLWKTIASAQWCILEEWNCTLLTLQLFLQVAKNNDYVRIAHTFLLKQYLQEAKNNDNSGISHIFSTQLQLQEVKDNAYGIIFHIFPLELYIQGAKNNDYSS